MPKHNHQLDLWDGSLFRGWKERQPVYSIRGRGEDSEKVRRSRSAPMMLGGWVKMGEVALRWKLRV